MSDPRRSSAGRPPPFPVEFDAFRVGVALAIVVGALSLVDPYLNALVLALVALAMAGWAAAHVRERSGPGAVLGAARVGGVLLVAAGAAVYFLGPAPLPLVRGLLLALAGGPLWWVERTAPRGSRYRSRAAP